MNRRQITLLSMLGAATVALIWSFADGTLTFPTFPTDSDELPVSHLALKLEAEFRRDIHNNAYSLDYSPEPPNTILISVAYYPRMDRGLLDSIVRAAAENAKGVARDQFRIRNLETKTHYEKLNE